MRSVVVGTAGHIDHGKSALVRALTGTDPDRLKEEKARGITIDLGFAHLDAEGVHLAFVDVPGHERFVKNMLAGVGGIDLVLFVVASDESVMPQTREHFDICRLLSVPRGVVALTKTDLVDRETLELVRLEVGELVAGSFLADAPIVPVSARTGAGLDELRAALLAVAARVPPRSDAGAARLPIDRVFSMKGFGTVVTGTLVSGRLREDDELLVAPPGRRVKVRGLQVHGTRCPEAGAGRRVAVNLAGIEVDEVCRGEVLMHPQAAEPTRVFDAAIEVLPEAKPIRHAARVRFHQGTAELIGRLAIVGPPDAPPGEAPAVRALRPGARAYVRVRLERPAVLTRGDRFILRSYSPPQTIAGGRVLDPLPPRGALRTQAALDRCRRLDMAAADPASADSLAEPALVCIREAGGSGLPIERLTSRLGAAPETARALARRLSAEGTALEIDGRLLAAEVLESLKQRIVSALVDHHRVNPRSEGPAREEVRGQLFGRGHPPVFERALADLARSGTIVARDRLALASHDPKLPAEVERACAALEQTYRAAGLAPPDVAAAAAASGVPVAVAEDAVRVLQREKVLVKLDALYFHEAALARLKQDVAAIKAGAPGSRLDVPAFKERFGVTRKFAIPLLEYLDRERVTRRVGDVRVIL